MYQGRPANEYPNSRRGPYLHGSLEEQFSYGLDHLRDGLGLAEISRKKRTQRKAQLAGLLACLRYSSSAP
jgi:hypothetical protein